MASQITATLPTLNFPREVDYPTQEDWAAFSAAAELNFEILGGSWSTQMQLWKTQANAMSTELNTNADLAQSIANYQGDWVSQGYTLGQTVSVGEVYYICKLTHATGQNPTTGGSLYWNIALGNWNLKVNNYGNETIAGVKTFTSSPIVPTPTTDFQSVPLKSTNITVNVGTGQTYTTINQALEYLSGFYPMYKKSGVTATINLKAGFVMAEQVLVSRINLGWITIVGEDAETIITHTALTTVFNYAYPAFGVDKGGTSPNIGQLFRFNVEKVGGSKHGLMAHGAGTSAYVLPSKGFIGAGTYGVYALNGSTIDTSNTNCSNAGTSGVHAVESSIVTATGANCSNAGSFGIFAGYGSIVNASSANCSNAGVYGMYLYASATVNANNAIIQNQTTGTARIYISLGSHIVATGINTTGGTVPALSQTANTLTAQGIIYQ